jgi:hypothetical protein
MDEFFNITFSSIICVSLYLYSVFLLLVLHLCVLLFTRELDTGEDRTAVTGYVIVNYKRRGGVGLGVVGSGGVLFRGG